MDAQRFLEVCVEDLPPILNPPYTVSEQGFTVVGSVQFHGDKAPEAIKDKLYTLGFKVTDDSDLNFRFAKQLGLALTNTVDKLINEEVNNESR